jgi:hypothetical protein
MAAQRALRRHEWRIGMDVLKISQPDNLSRFIKISPLPGKARGIDFDHLSVLSGEAISPIAVSKFT